MKYLYTIMQLTYRKYTPTFSICKYSIFYKVSDYLSINTICFLLSDISIDLSFEDTYKCRILNVKKAQKRVDFFQLFFFLQMKIEVVIEIIAKKTQFMTAV